MASPRETLLGGLRSFRPKAVTEDDKFERTYTESQSAKRGGRTGMTGQINQEDFDEGNLAVYKKQKRDFIGKESGNTFRKKGMQDATYSEGRRTAEDLDTTALRSEAKRRATR